MNSPETLNKAFQYPFVFSFRDEANFDTFLVAPENAALVDFLRRFDADSSQFCYIWGAPGSGRTHLLQALSNASDSAIYLPLSQLRDYGPDCLDGLERQDFLVIDDLQLVAGRRDWEEKLFYLFNGLHASGGKLCVSADSAPASLPLLLADLKSRLQLAVIYELRELDEAGKQRALTERAALRGIELKGEVAAYIMARSERGMRELTAVLDRLDRLSLAEKRRITIPFVREICGW